MKRVLLLFLTFSLLFSACGRKAEAKTPPIKDVSEAILGALDAEGALVAADEDYAETNFLCEDEVDECLIYLGTTREIGIFKLNDGGNAAIAEKAIKEYLQNEANSASTLLDLYPDEELEEKLALYKGATIAQKGRYVCYFVLPKNEAEKAKDAFLKSLK